MSRTLLIRPAAKRDIRSIRRYIANDNRTAARRFPTAVQQAIEKLREMLGLGSYFETANPRFANLRVFPTPRFENYLNFYMETARGIEVIRVIYAGMDLEVELSRFSPSLN